MTNREAFERYATERHLDVRREVAGNYYEGDTQVCYEVWQAAIRECQFWMKHPRYCLTDSRCGCGLDEFLGDET